MSAEDDQEGVELVTFQVLGKPEPQGSTTAFVPLKDGYPLARGGRNPDGTYKPGSVIVNITSDNPQLKVWRKRVEMAARKACGAGWAPIEGESLEVEAHFFLKRPEGHWGTGRNAAYLKDSAPAAPLVIPDSDKLLRAVLDGMTGVVYKDDSLVTLAPPEKHYAVPNEKFDGQGVRIIVRRRAQQSALDLPEAERVRFVAPAPAEVDAAQLAIG